MYSSFRPLEPLRWGQPETPASRRRSRYTFQATYTDTVDLLDREVEKLGADSFVIEADFREGDIKRDGMPRANARVPVFPGVRISFESKHGPLQYQTDTCERWEHNLRSIALGLESLRAVDRYGITARAEQYTGFKAIEGRKAMSSVEAQRLLVSMVPTPTGTMAGDYKIARRLAHPDHNGGERAKWDQLEEARKVLGL